MKKYIALAFMCVGILIAQPGAARSDYYDSSVIGIWGQPYTIEIITRDGSVSQVREGYVPLRHKEKYTLRVTNHAPVRVAVQFSMDGTPWENRIVVDAHDSVDLDTIPGTGKRLTFFAQGTKEAKSALLDTVSSQDLGLISATFVPERQKVFEKQVLQSTKSDRNFSEESQMDLADNLGGKSEVMPPSSRVYGAGGTGLSGNSDQRFDDTYFDEDPNASPVTLNVRLVERKRPDRHHEPDAHPVPGRGAPVSNSVPPPIR